LGIYHSFFCFSFHHTLAQFCAAECVVSAVKIKFYVAIYTDLAACEVSVLILLTQYA
jgi:hypothetical protein